jgi:hypothetical protein
MGDFRVLGIIGNVDGDVVHGSFRETSRKKTFLTPAAWDKAWPRLLGGTVFKGRCPVEYARSKPPVRWGFCVVSWVPISRDGWVRSKREGGKIILIGLMDDGILKI